MKEKPDVLQGTLALMVLKTLDVLGPQHGWGIARRIEQISGDLLAVNQGTLYPLLLKLEHEGSIASDWGESMQWGVGNCAQDPDIGPSCHLATLEFDYRSRSSICSSKQN